MTGAAAGATVVACELVVGGAAGGGGLVTTVALCGVGGLIVVTTVPGEIGYWVLCANDWTGTETAAAAPSTANAKRKRLTGGSERETTAEPYYREWSESTASAWDGHPGLPPPVCRSGSVPRASHLLPAGGLDR